jgi:hypothetical protein
MGGAQADRVERLMGLSHQEFLRSLPAAAAGMECRVEGADILLSAPEGRVRIELGPERQMRLGSLLLPQTPVRLSFDGFTGESREAFLRRFDVAFQRGGG